MAPRGSQVGRYPDFVAPNPTPSLTHTLSLFLSHTLAQVGRYPDFVAAVMEAMDAGATIHHREYGYALSGPCHKWYT